MNTMHSELDTSSPGRPKWLGALLLSTACAMVTGTPARADGVAIGNICPGGTLWGNTDFFGDIPTNYQKAAAQQDCAGNLVAGTNSTAGSDGSRYNTAINGATANGNYSVAVGVGSAATAGSSTAVGAGSAANGGASLAVGESSLAAGTQAVAVGSRSKANASAATALGAYANADLGGTAVGTNSVANVQGTATGVSAFAIGNSSSAFGYLSRTTGTNGSAFGTGSWADAAQTVALGYRAKALSTNDIALGAAAQTGQNSDGGNIAIGGYAPGTNPSPLVGAVATGGYSTSLGTAASATGINSIALGAFSSDGGRNNVLSVGTASQTRAIINVAAGTVSATSTDAITGSQLYVTNQNVTSAQQAANAAQASANAAQTSADAAQASADTAIANFTNGTVDARFKSANLNGGGISNAGTVSGVTAATTSDQAVNFGQLQAIMTQLIQSGLCTVNGNSVRCAQAPAGGGALQLGNGASAASTGAIAIGSGATITNPSAPDAGGAIAIGNGARANADPSVALGNNANANGANSVAVGDSSTAAGNTSTAFGYKASATGSNSVALGANSSDGGLSNVVSVGAPGSERRITNVAPGLLGTDAANINQLNAAINATAAGARAYTDAALHEARRYAARGVAASLAVVPQVGLMPGESGFGIGTGYFDGQSSLGASFGHMTTRGTQINLAGSYGDGSKMALRAGVGWKW